MTIDEAIKEYETRFNDYIRIRDKDTAIGLPDIYFDKVEATNRAHDAHQIADWLKELKHLRTLYATSDRVIKMLLCEIQNASDNPYVKKPISYALYHVWQEYDKTEKERSNDTDDMCR